MRILLLVDCYLPSPKSSAKLIHDLGREFLDCGHQVIIAAPDDSIPNASQLSGENGLQVLRIRTRRIKGAPKILRAWEELHLSRRFWNAGRDFFRANPCDLIVFYSPTIFFSGLVKRLKAEWNCPSYMVLRDIFPQWAIDAGVLREGLVARFFRFYEHRQYAVADRIGVQSPANLEYFEDAARASQRPKLEVLYNWTTLDEQQVPRTDFRNAWGLQNKVVFFYGGNMGLAQDMPNLLRLAERMRDDTDAHFLFVGEGSEVPRLRQTISDRQLTNVSLRDAVGQAEYLGMLAEFDVGLISLDRSLRTQNFPGKLLGYLYHQIPVLASVNPGNDLAPLLEQHKAGLVSINGDDKLLMQNARALLQQRGLRTACGSNGRRLLEKTFAVGCAAKQILQSVASLANIHRPATRAA